MVKMLETEDLRKQITAEITRDLGYCPNDKGAGYVAMMWGVAALGVLFLSNAVMSIYSAFDIGPYFMYSPIDELPHVMTTALLVAVAGGFYERRKVKKWDDHFQKRLVALLCF